MGATSDETCTIASAQGVGACTAGSSPAVAAAAVVVMPSHSASTSTRLGVRPSRLACWIISPVSPLEPRSAHRFDLEVILSVASARLASNIQ